MTVRARFAPAPSGKKHIGNYRTGLFAWLFARSKRGEFVLRIEDTDKDRFDPTAVEGICDALRWLGLDWDEGPYRQSERMEVYLAAAQRLEESGAAYRCWCTPEEVEEMRRKARAEGRPPHYDRRCRSRSSPGSGPSALRFAVPLDGQTTFRDLVRGDITIDNSTISDLVLVRADGTPVYMLAVVVDDTEMQITHVIRGEDLLPSTAFQILVGKALGRAEPLLYAHLPLVVGPDRVPLSTRHGPVGLDEFRRDGILAEAMVNYMGLLGFSMPDGREIFTLDELAEAFDITRVGATPAMFDAHKLDSVNFAWINRLPLDDLVERALPFFAEPVDRGVLRQALPLAVERVKRLTDLPPMLGFLFQWPGYDEGSWTKAMGMADALDLLHASLEIVKTAFPFDAAGLSDAHRSAADRLGLKYKVAFGPTRVAITGSNVGPPLWESMVILGREECLARLERARDRLTQGG